MVKSRMILKQNKLFSENFEDENFMRVPNLTHFPGNEWLGLTSKFHMPCLCLANVLPLLQKMIFRSKFMNYELSSNY